jgi:Holliday junction resolvase RusA-like endonuclease
MTTPATSQVLTLHQRIMLYVATVPPECVREFVAYGQPKPKRSTKFRTREVLNRKGKRVHIPVARKDEEAEAEKDAIRDAIAEALGTPEPWTDRPLYYEVEAVRTIKDRRKFGQLLKVRPDADNIQKLNGDATKGTLYHDDGQIHPFPVRRYVREGERPHVRVRIVDLSGFEP